MNSIDLNNLIFIDGSFSNQDDFTDLLLDNDGSFTLNNESMTFESNEKEVFIEYTVYVDGTITSEDGDWYTPGYTSVEVDNIDIDICSVTVDGIELVLTKEDYKFLTKIVEDKL